MSIADAIAAHLRDTSAGATLARWQALAAVGAVIAQAPEMPWSL